jgi:hypothetical protein
MLSEQTPRSPSATTGYAFASVIDDAPTTSRTLDLVTPGSSAFVSGFAPDSPLPWNAAVTTEGITLDYPGIWNGLLYVQLNQGALDLDGNMVLGVMHENMWVALQVFPAGAAVEQNKAWATLPFKLDSLTPGSVTKFYFRHEGMTSVGETALVRAKMTWYGESAFECAYLETL